MNPQNVDNKAAIQTDTQNIEKPRHWLMPMLGTLIILGIVLPSGWGGLALAAGVVLFGLTIIAKLIIDGFRSANKRSPVVGFFIVIATLGISFVVLVFSAYGALIVFLIKNPPES